VRAPGSRPTSSPDRGAKPGATLRPRVADVAQLVEHFTRNYVVDTKALQMRGFFFAHLGLLSGHSFGARAGKGGPRTGVLSVWTTHGFQAPMWPCLKSV